MQKYNLALSRHSVKKHLILLICLIFSLLPTFAFSQVSPMPIIEYRFEEVSWNGSPNEVIDNSANKHNGSTLGGITTTTGKICNAANIPYNNSATTIQAINSGVDLDTVIGSSGTISLWYKGNNAWSSGSDKRLFDATEGDKYFFAEIVADGRVKFWFEDGADGDYQITTDDALTIGADVWKHLTFVWDVANQTAKIYVDGEEQNISGATGGTSAFNGYGTLYFGDNRETSYLPGQSSADGLLDEALVFSSALTSLQIKDIFKFQNDGMNFDGSARSCLPSPIINYHFDEFSWNGSPGDVTDSSSNGYNATSFNSLLTDDTSPVIIGSPGTCSYGQFDGVDDYIQLPTSFPDLTESMTITAWIKAADLHSGSRIFIDDQSDSQGFGFSLSDGGTGKLRLYSRAVSPVIVDTQNAVITEGDWYFIAAVHDATTKTVKLYVDGVAQPLSTGGTDNTVSTYTGTWGSDTGPASIGGETNSANETGPDFYFNGAIDEPRIYPTALTEVQISEAMSETQTCPIPAIMLLEYRFEEESWNGTADEILDNSGNDHHAKVINNSTPEVTSPALVNNPGTCGYASQNDGSIQVTGLPLDTTTLDVKTTVTFWMNWDGTNSTMPIGWNVHDIWIVDGSIGFNTGAGDVYGISSDGLANGWHHVAVEFTNGSVTSNRMHIDGIEQVLTQRRGSPNNSRAFVNSELNIGGWSYNNGYDFHGLIDEVRVYQGVLTTPEVVNIMDERHPCPIPPIAEYHFDEFNWFGTAGDVTDSSGNGYNATSFNSLLTDDTSPVIIGSPGTCGYGQFDGVDDYIQLPTSFPDLTESMTFTAWIKADDLNLGSRIFIDDQNDSQGFGLSLSDGGAGKLRLYSRAVSPVSVDTQNVVISEGNWYFVAAVHDATTKTVKLYVDGVAQPLSTGGTDNTVSTYTGTWGSDTGPASIGGETNSANETGPDFYFNGAIDEPKVYPTALNEEQISKIMSETRTCPVPATLLLEYRFEEESWDGTTDEIFDNSGNDNHAKVMNNSAPEVASPALENNPGTCGYASQNDGSIQVTGLPLDTTTLDVKTTVTFWMNWDGTNSTMPIGWNFHDIWIVNGSIGFNTANSDVYGISSDGLANGWHHVAVEFTNGSVTSNRMHIDGIEQVLTQRQGSTNNSRAFVKSELNIGGWSYNNGYDFHGLIDEVRVYQGVLTTPEVVKIMDERHPCGDFAPDHYRIEHDTKGFTCEAEAITIKACADSECNTLYSDSTSITLSPSGWNGSDTLTFTEQLSTTLNVTEEGSITFTKVAAVPEAELRCFNGGVETCDMQFVNDGFEFSDANGGLTLPDQLAANNFTDINLRAIRNEEGVCKALLSGEQDITLIYDCDTPNVCIKPFAGIPRIGDGSLESSGTVTLTFDSDGIASLSSLSYADAGIVKIKAQAEINNVIITATTNGEPIDFYPSYLALSVDETELNYAGSANENNYIAGENFTFVIGAYGVNHALLPNYQIENSQLKLTRVAPISAGANGTFKYADSDSKVATVTAAFENTTTLPFSEGEYRYASAYYSEVGRIEIDVKDSDYLGNEITSNGALVLGNFYPAYFNVELSEQPILADTCSAFSYLGQDIDFSTNPELSITAYNALDEITQNYSASDQTNDNFWNYFPSQTLLNTSLSYLDISDYTSTGSASVVNLGDAPLIENNDTFTGTGTITLVNGRFKYDKVDSNNTNLAYSKVSPFAAKMDLIFASEFFNLTVEGQGGSQSICYKDNNASASCKSFTVENIQGTEIRYGRLALESTYGPETEPLNVPIKAEYFDSGQWRLNTDDNCTSIALTETTGQIRLTGIDGYDTNLVGDVQSIGNLILGKPVGDQLTLKAPDPSQLGPGIRGQLTLSLDPAATGIDWPIHLNYDWNGDGNIDNNDFPKAIVSFGQFRGKDSIIQWREVYN